MQHFFVKWFEVVPIFGGSIFQSCHNMHCDHQKCASTCSALLWTFPGKWVWWSCGMLARSQWRWITPGMPVCCVPPAVGKGSFWLIYFISTGVDWIIDRSAGLIKHPHCMTKARVTNCVLSQAQPWPSLPVFLILMSSSLTSWFLTLHLTYRAGGYFYITLPLFQNIESSLHRRLFSDTMAWHYNQFPATSNLSVHIRHNMAMWQNQSNITASQKSV